MNSIGQRPRRQNLAPLLHARSVAIVGISQPNRFGGVLYANLKKFGYDGRIFGVNPRYDSLYDQPCYDSLGDRPERPDCALLAVSGERLPAALEDVAASGIPAAAIFASAYSDPTEDSPSLQARLTEIAQTNDMVVWWTTQ